MDRKHITGHKNGKHLHITDIAVMATCLMMIVFITLTCAHSAYAVSIVTDEIKPQTIESATKSTTNDASSASEPIEDDSTPLSSLEVSALETGSADKGLETELGLFALGAVVIVGGAFGIGAVKSAMKKGARSVK